MFWDFLDIFSILKLLGIIGLLFKLYKNNQGSKVKLNKEYFSNIKKSNILIIGRNNPNILELKNQLIKHGAFKVIVASLISTDNSIEKNYESYKVDFSDLNSTNDFLCRFIFNFERSLFKIDTLIYDSSEIIIDHKSFKKTFTHNNLSYLLVIFKLCKYLDRGEGKIVQLTSNTFKYSTITYNKEEVYNHMNIINIYFSSNNSFKINYSNSAFTNIMILKFLREYTDNLFDNLTIANIYLGVDKHIFKNYLNNVYFYFFLFPLNYLLIKSPFYAIQPILELLNKDTVEWLHGGHYAEKNASITSENCKDVNIKIFMLSVLFKEIKHYFSEEEGERIEKCIDLDSLKLN